MNFTSDNVYGVHPAIMDAIAKANERLTDVAYSHDAAAMESEAALSEIFEKEVRAFFVLNGTGANCLALSTITRPHAGIFCHETSHIATDEGTGPELFTGGARPLTVHGQHGKLTPQALEEKLALFVHGEHGPRPMALSISQATEWGTVYTPAEVKALTSLAHAHNLKCHMDGARFANALVQLGCSPAEMTWKSGIDVLSFGGTKNGAMILECVVFFDHSLAEDFLYQRKRAAQHLSKGRYLSVQMLAYLKNDLWLNNARHANALAQDLANTLKTTNAIRLAAPVQANEIFPVVKRHLAQALQKAGAVFYEWPLPGLSADETCLRLVLSFATPEDDVKKFAALIKRLSN